MKFNLKIRWGVSKGRDTCGYTTCTLSEFGTRMAGCNGGGYDMRGTVLGLWIATRFRSRLNQLKDEFYGLGFYDPNFDPGKAIVPGTKQTVEEREKAGKSLGLERHQAFHGASSKTPTKRHIVPQLDGACGWDCMVRVLKAVGGSIQKVGGDGNCEFYSVTVADDWKAPKRRKAKKAA
jgi:hypothetical protein